MKEILKINLLKLLKKHLTYTDGFFFLDDNIVTEKEARAFIWAQGIDLLEKDITDILSEISYNNYFNSAKVDDFFYDKLKSMSKEGESFYFKTLDNLYPNNKFRQIMNYYLFSEDCYSFILVGYGQTGKSTFVNLISQIIGESFFGRSNVNLLRNTHGTASLEGKKIFEVTEAQDLDLDTANVLKSIITCDPVFINPKFQLPRLIIPHAKLIMTCNSVPRFKVTDDGIIRRFITIEMNNKINKQDKHFLEKIKEDIPYIIYEAMNNPFNISDFAEEQYSFFKNDPQFGFGFGKRNYAFDGATDYEKYQAMCKAFGFKARNKLNFDKFVELAKIYKAKCAITSEESAVEGGQISLIPYDEDDLPF